MMAVGLAEKFRAEFQKMPSHIFFCPGRVNLIGEHIDYNGGSVLPCAISLGTFVAISVNDDNILRFRSLNFSEKADIPITSSYVKTGHDWFNYPIGVCNELAKIGTVIGGMDMLFSGNLPIGAGLSSSASIEVLMAFAINHFSNSNISRTDMALMSKKAENEFIGVNSGIMDQFAVTMGKKGNAILLNCDTLVYEYIPFETANYQLVIINSNKKRKLTDSKYNERFAECRNALQLLKQEITAEHLCDIDLPTFNAHRHLLSSEVLEKRALHVISEHGRVLLATKYLNEGNMEGFGKLMYASHQSLKELYEVSGKELDTIVEYCSTFSSCIGARMTGAGFGGCAIALIEKKDVIDFSKGIIEFYKGVIGYEPEVFEATTADGVRELKD